MFLTSQILLLQFQYFLLLAVITELSTNQNNHMRYSAAFKNQQ